MSQKTNDVFEEDDQQPQNSIAQRFESMELNPDPKILEDLEKHVTLKFCLLSTLFTFRHDQFQAILIWP